MRDSTTPDLVTQLLKDSSFISDLARFHEELLTENFIRKKYGNLSENDWTQLGESVEIVHAIELETIRRTRSGASKREKAQQHIVAAPGILNDLMKDPRASPRHRVDAIKTLDAMSATEPDSPAARDNFTIRIILSADEQLTFSKYGDKIDDGKKTIDHNPVARKKLEHDHVNVLDRDDNDDADDDADEDVPRWIPLPPDPADGGRGGTASW